MVLFQISFGFSDGVPSPQGLWRLYKLLGSPDGVCKIAKKLRPLLISREAKGAKKSGVALFRMLQMGFMEALKNVKEDVRLVFRSDDGMCV